MARKLLVFGSKKLAEFAVAEYLIGWCQKNKGCGLGGATGRSPIGVWEWVWEILGVKPECRDAVVQQPVVFLDEYFGPYPSYHHWAWRNLRVGNGGFSPDKVNVPRGCFFEPFKENRIVTSKRLEEILFEEESRSDWEPRTIPGEDGRPPEVRIRKGAKNPLLVAIRNALADYDALVHEHEQRLQLLGIGVGGKIKTDPSAGGHIGFVEFGAAAEDTCTMLARLASSTIKENRDDFRLANADGDVTLEPSCYAVTQGISTILSAGELLLMAWGGNKQEAVSRMLLGEPGPKNPAAHVQRHPNATVYLDRAAFGVLEPKDLQDGNWSVRYLDEVPSVLNLEK